MFFMLMPHILFAISCEEIFVNGILNTCLKITDHHIDAGTFSTPYPIQETQIPERLSGKSNC
jgi:hypothetical protein